MFPVPFAIVWLLAIILFAVVEAVTVTALVSIWFSVGALAALIASFLTGNFWVQLFVFLIVSCGAFALLRPLARKYFTPGTQRTNADRLIGAEALVTETVDNLAATGQVSLKGQIWTARSEDAAPLEPGRRVEVLRIEGVKVIVRPVD